MQSCNQEEEIQGQEIKICQPRTCFFLCICTSISHITVFSKTIHNLVTERASRKQSLMSKGAERNDKIMEHIGRDYSGFFKNLIYMASLRSCDGDIPVSTRRNIIGALCRQLVTKRVVAFRPIFNFLFICWSTKLK